MHSAAPHTIVYRYASTQGPKPDFLFLTPRTVIVANQRVDAEKMVGLSFNRLQRFGHCFRSPDAQEAPAPYEAKDSP